MISEDHGQASASPATNINGHWLSELLKSQGHDLGQLDIVLHRLSDVFRPLLKHVCAVIDCVSAQEFPGYGPYLTKRNVKAAMAKFLAAHFKYWGALVVKEDNAKRRAASRLRRIAKATTKLTVGRHAKKLVQELAPFSLLEVLDQACLDAGLSCRRLQHLT